MCTLTRYGQLTKPNVRWDRQAGRMTGRQTHRQADKKAGRQARMYVGRQADSQTD